MTTWPSRTEWARARQTASHRVTDTPTTLSEYATVEEIAAFKIALQNRLEQLGQKTAHPFPFQRRCINQALALIDANELPLQTKAVEGARDILAPIHARFYAARTEAQKK